MELPLLLDRGVINPQGLRCDALQPDCARSNMRQVANGGYVFRSCSVGKVDQGRALAMSYRGTRIDESIKERQELLWRDLFLDPTQWWDDRPAKRSPLHPDFVHKTSKEALWLSNWFKPDWVESELGMCNVAMRVPRANAGQCMVADLAQDSHVGTLHKKCKEAELRTAVEAVDLLVQRGCHVHTCLFHTLLKRCIAQKDLVLGRCIHALTVKRGYQDDAVLASHIISMYASHGRLEEAMQVFTRVTAPSPSLWASIILAHAKHGRAVNAIQLYRKMRVSMTESDSRIFVAALTACATAADLASGREVHDDILRLADKPDIFVGNCLVDMYAKCGSLLDARRVFDNLPTRDVVTWNSMITGYARHGLGHEALALYACMQREGMAAASKVTFLCLLQACACVGCLAHGKQLHTQIQERGLESDAAVGSTLVDMFAKCGDIREARAVFDRLPSKVVVTWNSMIGGYAHHGLGQEALSLYAGMQHIAPDRITFVCLLKACGSVGALHQGKQLDARIQELGLGVDLIVGNSLVDMYAKCGSLDEARRVFDRLPSKDVVTWTALVHGYAQHSEGKMAIQCFEEMQQEGVGPNGATFISLLVACSHEGLVNEGRQYFRMMQVEYGIVPTVKHYTSMVDLLGRSGHLDEAEALLQTMPFQGDMGGWMSLLTACYSHADQERGRRCFDRLRHLEPTYSAAYVVLGNIYALADRWTDVRRIESLRISEGAWKKPAKACIEIKSRVHEFTVGDEMAGICSKLRSMNSKVKEEGGHVPQTELVLKPFPEQQKENALCGHAEKLAMAYGLLNTPDGTTLLVTKNLRMCKDCHSSTKIMSRLERREIIVRDAHRFHRFLDGSCSCGDRH